MSLVDGNGGGLSAADVAAVVGNNNGFGFGNEGGGLFWLLVLFLFGFGNGGWGNGSYGGYTNIGSEIYPWMNQSQQINDGFRDQMINGNIQGIQNSVTSGFGDDMYSNRRGRSPVTGRYISRGMDDYSERDRMSYRDGYSGHSIKDRMVARLESMMDEAKTEHERQTVNEWINRLQSN